MASAIDILINSRANPAGFKQAQTHVAGLRAAVAGIAPELNAVASRFGSLGQAITGAFTGGMAGPLGLAAAIGTLAVAAGGAALKLASDFEQLENQSRRVGTSTQNLQVLKQALEDAGVGGESAVTSLTFLSRAIATNDPLLKQLGITTKDSFQALLQLSEIFSKSSDTSKKTEIAFRLLGRGSAELLGVFDGLASALPQLRQEMERSGQLIGEDTAEQLRKLDTEADQFSRRWQGFMTRVAGQAATAANAIIDAFSQSKLSAALLITKFATNPVGFVVGAATAKPAPPTPKATTPVNPALLSPATQGFLGAIADARVAGTKAADALAKVSLGAKDAKKQTESLREQLAKLRAELVAMAQMPVEFPALRGPGTSTSKELFDAQQAGTPTLEPPPLRHTDAGEMADAQASFRQFLDETTSALAVFQNMADGMFSALAGGFNEVFQGWAAQAIRGKGVVVTIVRSMVQEILAQLAKIAAAKFLSFLLNFLPGGQVLSLASSVAASSLTPARTQSFRSSSVAIDYDRLGRSVALALQASGVDRPNLHISAIGPGHLLDQLAPGGSLYGAFQRHDEVLTAA